MGTTPHKVNADALGALMHETRGQLGISASEVARRAGVAPSTITRLEGGELGNTSPSGLRAIGDALNIPTQDIFIAAGWLPKQEVVRPQLRIQYTDLPTDVIDEVEAAVDAIAAKHGIRFDQHGTHEGNNKHDASAA